MTESCYRHSSFWVTCNRTAYNPPKLFLQNSTIEILEISLTGRLRILQFIGKTCYFEDGAQDYGSSQLSPYIRLPSFLTVNDTANKFTIVGCDTYGRLYLVIRGRPQATGSFSTGCVTTCMSTPELDDDSCVGFGCCQMTRIPKNIRLVQLRAGSYKNHTQVWKFNKCSYALLVEESAFQFSPQNLINLRDVENLPMVIDWAIGNDTCESARMNSSSYACISTNSECHKPNNGFGYRCQCSSGYEGNAYLDHGCKDIDECSTNTHNCTPGAVCHNTRGGFQCECPEGYVGNATGESGCSFSEGYSRVSDVVCVDGCIRDQSQIYRIAAGLAGAIILVMLLICMLYVEHKENQSKKRKGMFFAKNGGELLQQKLTQAGRNDKSSNHNIAEIFSSYELKRATNNYHDNMIVGEGGYGTVYRGELRDGNRLVAIKKPKAVNQSEIDQFINEVFVLSQISHRNVVKLLGCCLETEIPLLVYEYIEKGTLHSHIHNQDKNRSLHWNLRLKIATETADVLSYLHSGSSIPIIHRDVKSTNILLGNNSVAKVSDFGASKFVPMDVTRACTLVQGTYGYLDPEYMQTGELTDKSDVYSFGVVLLELITGMKAVIRSDESAEPFSKIFLHKIKQGCISEILDKTIVCDGNPEQEQQINEVAKLAERCLNVKGEGRPSMKRVATELEVLRSSGKQSSPKAELSPEEIESIDSKKSPDGSGKVDYYSIGTVDDSLKGFDVGR